MDSPAEGNKHREKRWRNSIRHPSTRRAPNTDPVPQQQPGTSLLLTPFPELIPSPSTSRAPGTVNGRGLPRSRPQPGSAVCSAVPIHSTETAPPRRVRVARATSCQRCRAGTGTLGGPPSLLPGPSWSPQPAAASPSPPKQSECLRRRHQPQSSAPWQAQPPKWKLQTQIFYLLNCC